MGRGRINSIAGRGLSDADEVAYVQWRDRWWSIGLAVASVFLGPLAPAAWAIIILKFFGRHADPNVRALLLKQLGVVVVSIPSGVFAFFIVGETLTDPGGIKGVALIVACALPVVALAAISWTWPDRAVPLIGSLMAGVVVMDTWYAVDPNGWRSFEDRNGPVSAVVGFVIVAGAVVLAWKRPAIGGVLMSGVAVVALALAALVHDLVPTALASAVVGLVPGVLFIGSASLERKGGRLASS